MVDGNASMYLGSPRMAEMVIGEHVSLEEMGGAKMHPGVSGCGHFPVQRAEEGIDADKQYLSHFAGSFAEAAATAAPTAPAAELALASADARITRSRLPVCSATQPQSAGANLRITGWTDISTPISIAVSWMDLRYRPQYGAYVPTNAK